MKQSMQVLTSSQTDAWYTPKLYTDAVREVLGEIDLDPASCAAANEWIGAKRFYTEEQDGLSLPWEGKVFLNPPYGKTGIQSNQEIWVRRLYHHYRMNEVQGGIALTKCVPGYRWWDELFHNVCPAVCFVEDRISFVKLNKGGEVVKTGKAKAGSNFWYFGENRDRFEKVFSRFGRIV